MIWDGRLFLTGGIIILCFSQLLMIWHKCSYKACLLRCVRSLEGNTIKIDRLVIQLDSMGSRIPLKLLLDGTG